eukprot:SAG31_NODE_4129_length_3555_cov_25.339988_3_plen_97_part_00
MGKKDPLQQYPGTGNQVPVPVLDRVPVQLLLLNVLNLVNIYDGVHQYYPKYYRYCSVIQYRNFGQVSTPNKKPQLQFEPPKLNFGMIQGKYCNFVL